MTSEEKYRVFSESLKTKLLFEEYDFRWRFNAKWRDGLDIENSSNIIIGFVFESDIPVFVDMFFDFFAFLENL